MLGNSLRGLNSIQKRHLYRCCTLPIVLYRFQLQYYNKVPLMYPLEKLKKMQRRAAIWITGAFCTSPTAGIKAIAGLIFICKNSMVMFSYELIHYHKITSSTHFLSQEIPTLKNLIDYHQTILCPNNDQVLRALQLTWTINLTKFSLLFLLSIMNFHQRIDFKTS